MTNRIGNGRRAVLQAGAGAAAALLLSPHGARADAAPAPADAKLYPTAAFAAKTEAAARQALFGKTSTRSDKIDLGAPEIAENGAVVPITVNTGLPNVTMVALLALDNPFTLAAAYQLPPGTMAKIGSRLKLAKSTKIVAVVESNGALFHTSRPVKVTLGGCG